VIELDTPGRSPAVDAGDREGPAERAAAGDRLRRAERRGAGSAGVFITLAAHVAAMAPGTNIGAAHPVGRGRGHQGKMGEKIENFTASLQRGDRADAAGGTSSGRRRRCAQSVSITAEEAARSTSSTSSPRISTSW
jgi:membrane-bound ClpP family serine protease